MDASANAASDVSETNVGTELEIKKTSSSGQVSSDAGEATDARDVPMDTSDSVDATSKRSEMEEQAGVEDTAVQESSSQEADDTEVAGDKGNLVNESPLKEDAPKKESVADACEKTPDGGTVKEGSPKKTDDAKTLSPGTQSITIVMSPSSGGQKTQTVRFISQEHMASLPMQTIQLPLKSSPIVLKATTIPMPTKTVSIVAKPSTSTSPPKVTPSVILPSTSKTPTKSFGIRKSIVGTGKGDSSSKYEAAVHQMVRPGGVTKAKMQSARVIVVPLQITKEMIAAKQKAVGKTVKPGAEESGKTELASDPEDDGMITDEKPSAKGKTPAKQVQKGVVKKTEDNSETKNIGSKSKTLLKAVVGKGAKKLGSDESDIESEDKEAELLPHAKSLKAKNTKSGGKGDGKVKDSKDDAEEESQLSEDEVKGKAKIKKVVKKVVKKKEKDVDDAEEEDAKLQTTLLKKGKNIDDNDGGDDNDKDSETEAEVKSKSTSSKGKLQKKMKKKEDEENEEMDSEVESKPKAVAAKSKPVKRKSQVKDESDPEEVKDDNEAEDKQDTEDMDTKTVTKRKRKTKAVKEDEGEQENAADSETEESGSAKSKKTPGRVRREKPKEEPVVQSTRRSKRESNLSVKLAEWGLLPVGTPKSHSKTAAAKSPVASRTPAAAKSSAAAKQPAVSKSPVASKSPAAAKSPVVSKSPVASPIASNEEISPPPSPEKPSGVTVTVIKSDTSGGTSQTPPEPEASVSPANRTSVTQDKASSEKQPAKSGSEWIAKAGSIIGSSATPKIVPKATPKVAPKAAKADKSTPVPVVKQVIKTQEKTLLPKPTIEIKQIQNKSLMCKPIMMTKATSCNPIRIHKITQTEVTDDGRKKKTLFVPVPVPVIMPAPVATCSLPTPYPVPLPVPLPVPCFIPTTRKSIDSLMKSLQDLHDQMPSDPFEADLLAMAEAVATAHKEVPDCVIEPDEIKPAYLKADPSIGVAATTIQQQASGGELSEDMLEMALRMAQEMPEEGSLELEATRERMTNHLEASQTNEFSAVVLNGGVQNKRAASSSDEERGPIKKARVETVAGGHSIPGSAVAFTKALPIKDSQMKLKYSCGVKAWKEWVKEKNTELEKVALGTKGRTKLFKHEILQCSTEELNLALSLFVKEARKPTGEEYAPDSIYYLCLGIQYYLYENGRIENIFTDVYYRGFSDTLNALLSSFQIRLNAQGIIICRITEEHLWESRQLGAHSPAVLLNTLVYLNTKYFMLNSTDAHVALSFANIMKQFKKNGVSSDAKQARTAFLRYNPTVFSDNRRKAVDLPVNPSEQVENFENPLRCPVKLYEFYLSKCPETIRNRNDLFYLTPEVSCVPDSPVWYSAVPLSVEAMSKMLSRIQVVREIQEAFLHNLQPVFA